MSFVRTVSMNAASVQILPSSQHTQGHETCLLPDRAIDARSFDGVTALRTLLQNVVNAFKVVARNPSLSGKVKQ